MPIDRYERRPYTFDRVIRILFSVCGLLATLYILNMLKGVLLPFLVACLVSYLLEPIVKCNMRLLRLKSRFVPVMLTLLETCLVAGGFCVVFVPYLVSECEQMASMIHEYATTQIDIPYISANVHNFIKENIDFNELANLLSKEEWKSIIKTGLTSSWSFLSSSLAVVAAAVSWLIVLLYIVFIMLDYEKLMLSFKQLVIPHHRHKVFAILGDIKVAMNRYFRGQFLIAMCVGVLFSIGFLIIGLPMAVGQGMLIGVLNMVPYLQIISFPVTALLCLMWTISTGGDFWLIFWEAMAVYIIVQCIQDLVLTPKIMGKAMGLNPAIILLSLSIWGALLGFMGLIIALPLTTLILSYYNQYVIQKNSNIDIDDNPTDISNI